MNNGNAQNSNWHSRLLQARGWLFVGAAAIALVIWLIRR